MLAYLLPRVLAMARFILLRLLHTVRILFGVSIVAFSLIHLIPATRSTFCCRRRPRRRSSSGSRLSLALISHSICNNLAWLGRVLSGNLGKHGAPM